MVGMNEGSTNSARAQWLFLVIGAAIGLALGIIVGVTTDLPFAPELGLVLGVFVGWLAHRRSTPQT